MQKKKQDQKRPQQTSLTPFPVLCKGRPTPAVQSMTLGAMSTMYDCTTAKREKACNKEMTSLRVHKKSSAREECSGNGMIECLRPWALPCRIPHLSRDDMNRKEMFFVRTQGYKSCRRTPGNGSRKGLVVQIEREISTEQPEPTSHCPFAAGWDCSGLARCCWGDESDDSDSTCCSESCTAAQGRHSHYRQLLGIA